MNKELGTCHEKLQELFTKVQETCPLTLVVVQGARTVEQARENFQKGVSKLDPDKGEFSKHIVGKETGRELSDAVDICPFRESVMQWGDDASFYTIAGFVLAVAKELNIEIRWGGGWDLHKGVNHLNTKGQLKDLGHFELV